MLESSAPVPEHHVFCGCRAGGFCQAQAVPGAQLCLVLRLKNGLLRGSRRAAPGSSAAARAVFLELVGAGDRAEPGFAAFDPEFVARHQSGRGIGENTRVDFGFIAIPAEKPRAAMWTEMPAAVFGGPAGVAHPI